MLMSMKSRVEASALAYVVAAMIDKAHRIRTLASAQARTGSIC
jgi:hypothetical protein